VCARFCGCVLDGAGCFKSVGIVGATFGAGFWAHSVLFERRRVVVQSYRRLQLKPAPSAVRCRTCSSSSCGCVGVTWMHGVLGVVWFGSAWDSSACWPRPTLAYAVPCSCIASRHVSARRWDTVCGWCTTLSLHSAEKLSSLWPVWQRGCATPCFLTERACLCLGHIATREEAEQAVPVRQRACRNAFLPHCLDAALTWHTVDRP
jgi:hypothetical protein